MLQVWNPVHLNFQGNGDLLFDFFCGASGPLRDYLYPSVGNVGISFDRELLERDDAPQKQKRRHAQHDEAIIERALDQQADHYCSAMFWNSSALATTFCPALRPPATSCMPPASISPLVTST